MPSHWEENIVKKKDVSLIYGYLNWGIVFVIDSTEYVLLQIPMLKINY
jgi:hypothetical protein